MIALIPARGGSKGLPGKNIKLLDGKPLIAYSIEAALESEYISKVIVSTEDENIAEVSLKYGAEVPFMRPSFLATDEAKSSDVIKFTVSKLEEISKLSINEIVLLQPTSPLRTSHDIDLAVKLFKNKNADSVISFCKESHSIFWHKFINEFNQFEEIFEGNFGKNRQDLRPSYYPNGSIYILNRELINNGKQYTENSYAYIMKRENSVDIDYIEDFEYAEFLLKKRKAID